MAHHNIEPVSESEQMYLITVARLVEDGVTGPIPLSVLANELSVQPVSVHQMARKMEEDRLVEYIPYKGIELTADGSRIAAQILRNRRLWEVFLVDHLNLPLAEADAFACIIEHATSTEIAERLSTYLGAPAVSPRGEYIPQPGKPQTPLGWTPLTHLTVGQRCQVMQVQAAESDRMFLAAQGLHPGVMVTLQAIGRQAALLLEVDGRSLHLSPCLAESIFVQAVEVGEAKSSEVHAGREQSEA